MMLTKLTPALIAFEGTECAGKTTAIQQVKQWIEDTYQQEVVLVRAPGQTEVGKQIRAIVTGDLHTQMSDTVNAMLFAADWRNTLEQIVIPAIERGAIVLTDRCNITCWVYQYQCKEITKLIEFNNKLLTPSLVLILTTPFDVFVNRRDQRDASQNNARDYIEKDVHDGMVERYTQYLDYHPKIAFGVDCLQTPEQIFKDIKHVIKERFGYVQ